MARPIKPGLDYFPHNTRMNYKVDLVEAKYGLEGYAIILKLYEKIYDEHGYYCEWNNDIACQFAYKLHIEEEKLNAILDEIINRGILDRGIFEKYSVLTSKGIQKRFCEGIERRTTFFIKEEYLLVDIDLLPNCVVFDEKKTKGCQNIVCYEDLSGEDLRERLKKDFPRYNWNDYKTEDFNRDSEILKLFFLGAPDISFAEYDIILKATSEAEGTKYINKLKRYPNARNKFALVMTWIQQDCINEALNAINCQQ